MGYETPAGVCHRDVVGKPHFSCLEFTGRDDSPCVGKIQ
jgi:hypothetical protein